MKIDCLVLPYFVTIPKQCDVIVNGLTRIIHRRLKTQQKYALSYENKVKEYFKERLQYYCRFCNDS